LGKTWQSKGILPDFLVEQSNASYNNLKKLPLDKRLSSDIGTVPVSVSVEVFHCSLHSNIS